MLSSQMPVLHRHRTMPLVLAVFALLVLPAARPAVAGQARPVYLDHPAEVMLPVGYESGLSYPVFVVLPPTGSRASQMARRMGLDPERQREFILVFPPGRPLRSEYLPDFVRFVEWYEERLFADLDRVFDTYSANPSEVYLGGYSLGGDLSWALSARNPDRFAGAVMAGTRTSYPINQTALDKMRESGFRAAFLIGDREARARYDGINYVHSRLQRAGVETHYGEYSGGHVMPPTDRIRTKIAYVTEVENLPSETAPVAAGRPAAERRPDRPRPGREPQPIPSEILVHHLTRPSSDRVGLRVGLPAEVGGDGWQSARDNELQLRIEWPWSRYYLRSVAGYTGSRVSTGLRHRRISQDLVFGIGSESGSPDTNGFFGAGIGWDWLRTFDDDDAALRQLELLFVRGDRNLGWIPSRWHGDERVDSLLTLRYIVPRGITHEYVAAQVLNLRAQYLLRLGELVVVDAGVGSYAVQNRSISGTRELADALDHRLEWELGFGFRAPAPFLWRVSHRGTAERPVDGAQFEYRPAWRLTLEYSF